MSNDENTQLAGSSPAMRTTFPIRNGESIPADTDLTQETPEKVNFPKQIKARKNGPVLAVIYAPSKAYPKYRVVWAVAGKRVMKGFRCYSGEDGARAHADELVKDLAKGSRVTALTPRQADDALAAFDKLRVAGIKVSLLTVVSDYVENVGKLHGHTLSEAVNGFTKTVASVKRKDIKEAVEDFIKNEEPRTKAKDGTRPDLSPKYHYNRAIMLRRFAAALPGTAFEDLTKEHLDLFMGAEPVLGFSAKSRNHHRAAIRQLLTWAIRKDYISATHRLFEAVSMQPQRENGSETQFYTPAELKALLDASKGQMRAMVAIGGLAGLRTEELLRLSWEDVRKVEGHIEITKGKAKTRQRRLVEIVPALAQWLAPYSEATGKVWTLHEITFQQHFVDLCADAKMKVKGKEVAVARKPNGLRHAFCTYHFALHANENKTAMEAGNSPQMVHAHYKGLARKQEAEAWFSVSPALPENVMTLSTEVNDSTATSR